MKYAIVESGGKQYRAVEGGSLEVDRLPVEPGATIKLEQILLLADGENVTVGTPVVKDSPVWAKVVEHFKGKKVTIFNYSPKKRIRVKTGHRQNYTRLLVEQIGGSELVTSSPQGKKEPVKKVEKTVEAKAETESPKAKTAKAEPKAKPSSLQGKRPAATASPKGKATKSEAKKAPAKAERTSSSPKGKAAPAKAKTTEKKSPKSAPKPAAKKTATKKPAAK